MFGSIKRVREAPVEQIAAVPGHRPRPRRADQGDARGAESGPAARRGGSVYHPAGMRRAGPILIVVIGVLALLIDFFPTSGCPTRRRPTAQWRPVETKLGLDLEGGLRVEYQALPKDGQSPTAEAMGVIKDIIERRVNTTGVSEPVVVVQGSDRVVIELPGVTDVDAVRRLVGQTGQLDFVPLGTTDGDRRPGPRPARPTRRCSAATRSQSAAVGQDQNGGLAVDFVLKDGARSPAPSCSPSTRREHVGEYFAITLDERVISRAGHQEPDPERPGPDHRRRPRRLPGEGGQRARHGPQVRLAAVPDRRAVERADLGHARRAVPQPEPAGRAHRHRAGHRVHAHLLPAARASSRPSRSSTTRSSCSPSSGSSRSP